ncbi:MAG: DUF1295 domain-containing protein [Clostridia bacterium]|nr:DUF1295 domain-containing protein [Clostridia bacterium]
MQKIKNSRALSFIIVAFVYIFATIGALLIYPVLPLPWWASLLIVDILATIFVFLFSLIFENASVYDPYWSVQPIVIVLAYAVGKPLTVLRALLIVAVLFWGIRLTANWAYTFGNLTHQDWRYTMLKEKTKKILSYNQFPWNTSCANLSCLSLLYSNRLRIYKWPKNKHVVGYFYCNFVLSCDFAGHC